jgi:hypothetical protein
MRSTTLTATLYLFVKDGPKRRSTHEKQIESRAPL